MQVTVDNRSSDRTTNNLCRSFAQLHPRAHDALAYVQLQLRLPPQQVEVKHGGEGVLGPRPLGIITREWDGEGEWEKEWERKGDGEWVVGG